MKRKLLLKQFVLVMALCTGVKGFSQTVVSDCNLNGWTIFIQSTGTVTFVNGPSNPPLPVGSVYYTLGADGSGKAALITTQFAGTHLSTLTTLSYSTFVSSNQGGQALRPLSC